ncbi:MAG: HpcH/HpaI aldolase/citrate lyase family protein [Synergistales bacterium]|nr:HpcH/HpaI aldolase/citrate lyase family protein [Synergistales bacterium]
MVRRLRRTALYIPGNDPSMILNSGIFGADSIVLDLEDAVSINEKDSSRILVRNALQNVDFGASEVVVRINALSTPFGKQDIEAIVCPRLDAIRLPKCEYADDIMELEKILDRVEEEKGLKKGSVSIMPLIESAMGSYNAVQIAKASRRNSAVNFGGEDYTADMGAQRTREGAELLDIRMRILLAARIAGIDALDTVFGNLNDEEGLLEETKLIKQLGFDGKSIIHPRQIRLIHDVFTPSEKEINKARRIIEAIEEAEKRKSGVVALDGRMIDAPVVAKARRVLAFAEAVGLV